ncbi:MAG: hypothetical protein ACC645_17095 [Pirellulales bacterium]
MKTCPSHTRTRPVHRPSSFRTHAASPSPWWVLIVLFSAATTVPPALGQVTVVEDEDAQLQTYRMTVSPAADPDPAFKVRLLKHENKRKEGNAAPFYYRAQLNLDRVSKAVHKEFGDAYTTWQDTAIPLDKLPKEKVRNALSRFSGIVMGGLREATSRKFCDWGWELQNVTGLQAIAFLLPEVQKSRELARMLALQTRLAIAENRLDDAIGFTQMNYQLGRDTAAEPLLICGLVGIAISGVANEHTLEIMASPNAPNLYWALAELPKPLIDLRRAMRFELEIGPRVFPLLNDAEEEHRSPAEWSRYIGESCMTLLNDLTMSPVIPKEFFESLRGPEWEAAKNQLIGTAVGLWGYTRAKQELIRGGMSREEVEAMSVGRVIALQAARAYRHTTNELEKLSYMPFPEMKRRKDEIEKRLRRDGYFGSTIGSREILPIASLLLPGTEAARNSQERLAREIAAMQVIEALRMHAAETGRFPAALEDVTVVPVPRNPATGLPFVYHTRTYDDRRMAILELPDTDGFPSFNRRYEIRLRE